MSVSICFGAKEEGEEAVSSPEARDKYNCKQGRIGQFFTFSIFDLQKSPPALGFCEFPFLLGGPRNVVLLWCSLEEFAWKTFSFSDGCFRHQVLVPAVATSAQ